jgi:hypothetical protein
MSRGTIPESDLTERSLFGRPGLDRIIAEHLGTQRRTLAIDKIFGRALTDPLPNRNILTAARRASNPESIDERVALRIGSGEGPVKERRVSA